MACRAVARPVIRLSPLLPAAWPGPVSVQRAPPPGCAMTHVWSSVSLPAVLASRFKASVRAIAAWEMLRTEVLAGLVVALALIPEAISFSIIAGVDPAIGLFASFTMAVTIAIVGGRPAMISAATGAVALVVAPLDREHGFGYLVAAVILGGRLPGRPRARSGWRS